jgi:hypothetical protein
MTTSDPTTIEVTLTARVRLNAAEWIREYGDIHTPEDAVQDVKNCISAHVQRELPLVTSWRWQAR